MGTNTKKEGENEVLDSYLKNVSDEHIFYMDEKEIRNLKDLLKEIKASNNDAFGHHVHKQGNDFYNWINHVVKDQKLATQIKNLTLKHSFVKVLEKRVSFLKKLNMGTVQENINVFLKTHDKKLVFIVDKEKCTLCDICTKVCPKDAISVGDNIEVDKDKCTLCGFCVPFCPTAALDIKDKNPMEDRTESPEMTFGWTLGRGRAMPILSKTLPTLFTKPSFLPPARITPPLR